MIQSTNCCHGVGSLGAEVFGSDLDPGSFVVPEFVLVFVPLLFVGPGGGGGGSGGGGGGGIGGCIGGTFALDLVDCEKLLDGRLITVHASSKQKSKRFIFFKLMVKR